MRIFLSAGGEKSVDRIYAAIRHNVLKSIENWLRGRFSPTRGSVFLPIAITALVPARSFDTNDRTGTWVSFAGKEPRWESPAWFLGTECGRLGEPMKMKKRPTMRRSCRSRILGTRYLYINLIAASQLITLTLEFLAISGTSVSRNATRFINLTQLLPL